MFFLEKDDFDESIEDIMSSINKLLDQTGEGYVVDNIEEKKEKEN